MDKVEARGLLDQQLARYRARSYDQLLALLDTQDTFELMAPSGTSYQLEVQAFWDDRANKHLRVTIAIDDGGWRAFLPMTDSFIIDSQGQFIGE